MAEQKLKEARGRLLTGFMGEDAELLSKAKVILTYAESIASEMEDIADRTTSDGSSRKQKKRGSK